MTNNWDFDKAVGKIEEYLEDMGNSDIVTEENDQKTVVVVGAHEDAEFIVNAPKASRYFQIYYRYDVYEDIKSQLSEEDAVDYLSGFEGVNLDSMNENQIEEKAAKHILTNLNDENQKVIIFHLVEAFATSNVNFRISDFDGRGLREISVGCRIFPYEDDFSIRIFNHKIEAVRSSGRLGETYLRYVFNLGVDDERELGGDVLESRLISE